MGRHGGHGLRFFDKSLKKMMHFQPAFVAECCEKRSEMSNVKSVKVVILYSFSLVGMLRIEVKAIQYHLTHPFRRLSALDCGLSDL
jgi:hypothetical protein